MARLKEDVLGFDVPVDKPVPMGVMQGFADLASDAGRLLQRKAGLPVEARPQGFPLHEWHDEVPESVSLSGVVKPKDVGVVQPGDDLDLPKKPIGPERCRQLGPEYLDGHGAPMLEVFGQIDCCHASTTDLAFDAVAISQRSSEAVHAFHQGGPRKRRLSVPAQSATNRHNDDVVKGWEGIGEGTDGAV